ncbi:MAG TPA: cupin domain-containing protein [Telluria sp.]|jgi:quercetin dioxygenase-like cupin family protein
MPFIAHTDAPAFKLHGASFTGLASPARGATETAVWIVALAPGTPGTPHQLTREEIFVGLEGQATATVGEAEHEITPGSALIVPAHTTFTITNRTAHPFRAVAVLPVGGQAQLAGQAPFTPPWAA